MFSNPVNIGFGQDTFYFNGAAFSPNSRFIYASCYTKIWQFDTWASDISASRILIGELNTPPNILEKTSFNQARLAPDGKIYIAGTNSHNHLHIINRPNCYGSECDLQQYAIELAARNKYTMPNMPHYKHWNESDTCETVSTKTPFINYERSVRLYPNPTNTRINVSCFGGNPQLISVFSSVGENLIEVTPSEPTLVLDVSTLPNGVYFVKIQFENQTITKKFSKTD